MKFRMLYDVDRKRIFKLCITQRCAHQYHTTKKVVLSSKILSRPFQVSSTRTQFFAYELISNKINDSCPSGLSVIPGNYIEELV